MKIITSFNTLMKYAYELGQAQLSGDAERIRKAQDTHDRCRDLCLRADEMAIGRTTGDL